MLFGGNRLATSTSLPHSAQSHLRLITHQCKLPCRFPPKWSFTVFMAPPVHHLHERLCCFAVAAADVLEMSHLSFFCPSKQHVQYLHTANAQT